MFKTIKIGLLFTMLALVIVSCAEDQLEDPITPNPGVERELWTGPVITFTKAPNTDPTNSANQDRITDNVWITRGASGQIYNIMTETEAEKNTSPKGTTWAFGTLDDIDNLEFKTFRATVDKPKNAVGENLVMHLVEDNIYISVKITSWGTQDAGSGFSYERSTPE